MSATVTMSKLHLHNISANTLQGSVNIFDPASHKHQKNQYNIARLATWIGWVTQMYLQKWLTLVKSFLFFFFLCILAGISKINRINGGTGLSPANQIFGLSSLARVEALRPRGCWGLGWGRGGRRRAVLSWSAVAWVPGTKRGKRGEKRLLILSTSPGQTSLQKVRNGF